jgi:hypothetical protein
MTSITHRIRMPVMGASVLVMATVLDPAAASETCASGGAGQFFNEISYCVSSVRAPEEGTAFAPENLFKGDPGKAWCAGAPDYGIGATITIRIKGGSAFRRLLVSNGFGKSPATYAYNARVRTVDVTGDGGLNAKLIFPDRKDMVPINLPSMPQNWIRLRILDAYPGEKFANACLGYITPDFEYEEELLMRQQGLKK